MSKYSSVLNNNTETMNEAVFANTFSMMRSIAPESEPYITVEEGRYINVPEKLKGLFVKKDNNCETVFIKMNKYYDGESVLNHNIYIDFINVNGDGDSYPITKDVIEEFYDYIIFPWTIDDRLTVKNGTVYFAIRVESLLDDKTVLYSYHTTPAILEVKDGIDVSVLDPIAENYPTAMQVWLDKMNSTYDLVQTAIREGGIVGSDGKDGITYLPTLDSETGILSWTNDSGDDSLPNPDPVKIGFTETDKQELINEISAIVLQDATLIDEQLDEINGEIVGE